MIMSDLRQHVSKSVRNADLRCASQCHAELRSAAQAELRNALLSYAVLHGATLRCATNVLRSAMLFYAVPR